MGGLDWLFGQPIPAKNLITVAAGGKVFSVERGNFPEDSPDVLIKHFAYQMMIEENYRHRESDPHAIAVTIAACESQIAISSEVAKAMRRQFPRTPLPGHTGFKQLCVIREKEGNLIDAIRLAKLASEQGWTHDQWEKRVSRCEAKLAKKCSH